MEKEFNPKVCPYCGSENFEHMGENDYWNGMPWHCHECDCWFSEDDCKHEDYWHRISGLIDGMTEDNPFVFEKEYVILPSVEEDSCGLSDLEKPNIEKICQVLGEGTMWYHIEGAVDADLSPLWEDMHELSTEDLKALLGHIIDEKIHRNG